MQTSVIFETLQFFVLFIPFICDSLMVSMQNPQRVSVCLEVCRGKDQAQVKKAYTFHGIMMFFFLSWCARSWGLSICFAF